MKRYNKNDMIGITAQEFTERNTTNERENYVKENFKGHCSPDSCYGYAAICGSCKTC